MMTKITQTVPFTFDELFEESRKIFKDAGFDVADGSNTSQLAAVMSYLVSSLNTNTALNINETLLPYATKRKNILQDARVLGYEIKHKTSYQYRLKIRLDDKMCGYKSFTFKKFNSITANGKTYYYFGTANLDSAYANTDLKVYLGILEYKGKEYYPDQLTFNTENPIDATTVMLGSDDVTEEWNKVVKDFRNNQEIELLFKEGELIKTEDDVSSLAKTIGSVTVNGSTYTRNYIDIPYTDVENDGIECLVSYFDNSGNFQENVLFNKTEDYFFESDGDDFIQRSYLRLDDIEMGTPRLYFRYAGMGTGIPYGSTVKLNILITHAGDGGMGELEYETVETSTGSVLSFKGITLNACPSDNNAISDVFDDCIITACDLVQTGVSEESNESIQENAPKVYNSAYRLVTNLDYKAACNRSTYVNDSSVWGGEDEFPKSPGHIWFSFLPEKTSERGFSSNADNSEYQRNNSILIYNYQEGESKYQYALRQAFYQKNYILNTEIKNYSIYKDHNGVHLKYGGVWGDLTNSYVPSLTFHHRHPLYLNFNYDFNILKYNIKQPTSEIHDTLFKALDNCFYGNDSLNLEKFESEYFHTNIVKRIDYLISDLCGFTSSLKNQIVLNEKTLCVENWNSDYKDIYIPLCVPFEKYFTNSGFLDIERLPCIDTERFIDYRFDEIVPPVSEYPYVGDVINKYDYLRYSVIHGDLFVDWNRIKTDQTNRMLDMLKDPNNDYSDLSTKIFVAPVKIDMTYKYYCSKTFMESNSNYIQLGFKLAPENTVDESFNNIKISVFDKYQENGENIPLFTFGKDCTYPLDNYFSVKHNDRDHLTITPNAKNMLKEGYVVEVNFIRTCGYYYLFNSFKKEILVHLFVNGSYEGFEIAKTGMKNNEYYDHYLDKLRETWEKNEKDYSDEDMYVDITYSSPRSYLYTIDKRYLTLVEPTGEELELEKHLFNYGDLHIQDDGHYVEYPSSANDKVKELFMKGYSADDILRLVPEIAKDYDDRKDDEEKSDVEKRVVGHYLTTEGYLSDGSDLDEYTGPIVREYNENMYLYTPLTVDLFRQNVYMDLKYPSENFRVHRNVIPRLNNVKFKNAVELY